MADSICICGEPFPLIPDGADLSTFEGHWCEELDALMAEGPNQMGDYEE